MKKHFWLAAMLFPLWTHFATAALSGTRTIGPSGDYASIGAAIADVQTQTLDGALILELQTGYNSAVETFPIVFTNLTTTADNTLTLRPAAGPNVRSITSAATAATVDLNGARFLTIDGRAGGTGTARLLTVANTAVAGVALRFINGASSDILRDVIFQGVNTSVTNGVVFFSTTSGTAGNDNNLIDNCVIRDGVTAPVNALYSLGATNSVARYNSGNIVTNCTLFNFYANSLDVAGLRLDGGNTDWVIAGNSFFQTNSRGGFGGYVRAIYLNNTNFGNNFAVTANYIGGSTLNAGGTNWATSSLGATYQFIGIELNVATNTPSSVQGNVISNILWQSASTVAALPGVWCGIYVSNGAVDIGSISGNQIGRDTGTNCILVTCSAGGGTTFGIGSDSRCGVNIINNTVGAITANGSAATVSASLAGIQANAGTNFIAGNLVGSLSTSNSLNAATASTSGSGQFVVGILSNSGGGATITNNTVANFNDNYVGTATAGQLRGIVTSGGINTISDNTVRNFSTSSLDAGNSGFSAIVGIAQSSTGASQTISHNVVHTFVASAAASAVSVTGIYYSGGSSGTNIIAQNFVHSLAIPISSSASSTLVGLQFDAGSFNVQNNMVRLGLNAAGNNTGNSSAIRAIQDNGGGNARNFYYNSVYVGGFLYSGSASSYAFASLGSGVRDFRDNIFLNARHRTGGSGNDYAISLSSTNTLTCDGNLYCTNGSGGVLGRFASADWTTLAAWQAVTGLDASSFFTDPLFAAPTGTESTVDLHLQSGSPATGAARPVAAVSDDFDGDIRSLITPNIGADENPDNTPVGGNPFTLVVELGVTKPVLVVGGTNAPTDPDNDPLTITQVTGSPNSVVSTDGTNVFYTGMSDNEGSFTYTVSDGRGGVASQTIEVIITPSTNPQYDQVAATLIGGGTCRLEFLGTPNFDYALELATNLLPPVSWLPQVTNATGADGWLFFTNMPAVSPAFYRTRFVP